MKISVQTDYLIRQFGVDKAFALIKETGFEAVDLAFPGIKWEEVTGGIRNPFYFDGHSFNEFVDEVKAASEKYGVAIGQTHAPAPTVVPQNPVSTANMRESIAMAIEATAKLSCSHIIIHPCFDGSSRYPKFTRDEEYKENIDYYTSIIPLLKKAGVTCCLENMWAQDWATKKIYASCCADMRDAVDYIDKLNAAAGEKRFAFCLDIGHLLLASKDVCDAIEILGDRLEALHVHDNNGTEDTHTNPYFGFTNWARFIKGLRAVGYRGNINFENDGYNQKFDDALLPAAMRFTAEMGKYFKDKVLAE